MLYAVFDRLYTSLILTPCVITAPFSVVIESRWSDDAIYSWRFRSFFIWRNNTIL